MTVLTREEHARVDAHRAWARDAADADVLAHSITTQEGQKVYNAGREAERKRIVALLQLEADDHGMDSYAADEHEGQGRHEFAATVLRALANTIEKGEP